MDVRIRDVQHDHIKDACARLLDFEEGEVYEGGEEELDIALRPPAHGRQTADRPDEAIRDQPIFAGMSYPFAYVDRLTHDITATNVDVPATAERDVPDTVRFGHGTTPNRYP